MAIGMHGVLLRLASAACVCLTAAMAGAEPPKVVRAVPDLADTDVDPSLASIVIEFDTDMAQAGHSICGGGPDFPAITAKPKWKNPRTIEVPVKLEPGKTYTLSINCPSARNFKSANGEAAEIYPITFKTRGADQAAPAPLTKEAIAAAVGNLQTAIDTRYSHRDLKKVDWAVEFAQMTAELEAGCTRGELARRLAKSLAKANDLHIAVRIDGMTIGTAKRYTRPNSDERTLAKMVKDLKRHNARVATGTYGGIPYLLIADWSGPRADYEPAFEFLKANASAAGMIVDVRPNAGGDEVIARELAGCFVKERTVYSRNKIRTPDAPGGWTDTLDRVIEPTPDRPQVRAKVCVLMGRANMSSCESFLCMMRYGAGAYLLGESSFGSSGNPKPYDVGEGIAVLLPSWIDMTPDDTLVEGRGIPPDELVEWTPPAEGMMTPDTVLGAAWKHLQPKPE